MFNILNSAFAAIMLLRLNGYEAYLVGGCVRDLFMGKFPKDWDITTNARPEEVKQAFYGYKYFETGLKHGTITVIVEETPLEITTYRVDGDYSDNRHPDNICFSQSLQEDLSRRDFTMNALAYDIDGQVIDFYQGRSDISAGIIRCVGDPEKRFSEDALRILRALRFSSVLGFKIERATAAAIHDTKHLLENISAERICEELTKILCGKNSRSVLKEYADVINIPIPELSPMFGFAQRNKYHCYDVWEHTIAAIEKSPPLPAGRWAALFHDIGKPACFSLGEDGRGHFYGHQSKSKEIADNVMGRLKFDNATRDKVLQLVENHMLILRPDKKYIKRLLNGMGEDLFKDLLQLQRADNLAQAPEYHHRQEKFAQIEALLAEIIAENACFSLKDLAVNGHDLLVLGLQGKEIGLALNSLLNAVIDEKVVNEREALMEYFGSISIGVGFIG